MVYFAHPDGASVTRTRAPRLTIAPGRGDWAIVRPLPRSSGSSAASASLRTADRAGSPVRSGTTDRFAWRRADLRVRLRIGLGRLLILLRRRDRRQLHFLARAVGSDADLAQRFRRDRA